MSFQSLQTEQYIDKNSHYIYDDEDEIITEKQKISIMKDFIKKYHSQNIDTIMKNIPTDLNLIIRKYIGPNSVLPQIRFNVPFTIDEDDYYTSSSSLFREQTYNIVDIEFFNDYNRFISSLPFEKERIVHENLFSRLCYINNPNYYRMYDDCFCNYHITVGYKQHRDGDWCMGESGCSPSFCGCDCDFSIKSCNHKHDYVIESTDLCLDCFYPLDVDKQKENTIMREYIESLRTMITPKLRELDYKNKLIKEIRMKQAEYRRYMAEAEKTEKKRQSLFDKFSSKTTYIKCSNYYEELELQD
jgi:hypothetical protein